MFIRRFAAYDPGGQAGGAPAGTGTVPPASNPPADGNPGGNTPPKDEPPKGGEGENVDSLPAWAQKTIRDLRKENASHRTKANSLEERLSKIEGGLRSLTGDDEDPKVTPEQKLAMLQGHLEGAMMQNQILGLAVHHGIPKEGIEYFQFLVNRAVDGLKEGDELDEEALTALATEARSKCSPLPGGGTGTTSVTTQNGPGAGAAPGEMSVEEFSRMTMAEKTDLYRKNPEKYNELMSKARNNYLRRK